MQWATCSSFLDGVYAVYQDRYALSNNSLQLWRRDFLLVLGYFDYLYTLPT